MYTILPKSQFNRTRVIENYNLLMIFQPFTKQLCGSGRQTFEGTHDCKKDYHKIRPMVKANTPINTMAIRVVEFSNGGYKIRKIFA